MEKVCCGGFYLGEGLELDGRTLKATGGSGLPDPSALTDGTAMVAVDGEWTEQEGYGYYKHPNSVTLVCDEMRVGEQSYSKTMNFTKLDFDPNAHVSLTVETPSETEVIQFDVPLGFSFTKTFTVGIYTIIMNAHMKNVETSDIPSIIVTGAMFDDQIKISGFVDANADISYAVPFSSDFVTPIPKTSYANSLVYVSSTGYHIIDPPTTAGNYLLSCEAVQSGFAMNIQYSWIPDQNTTVTV